MVEAAFAACGISAAQLDLIGVGAGAGSFTGLRIGMALAKGQALPRAVPCAAVSSLEGIARGDLSARGGAGPRRRGRAAGRGLLRRLPPAGTDRPAPLPRQAWAGPPRWPNCSPGRKKPFLWLVTARRCAIMNSRISCRRAGAVSLEAGPRGGGSRWAPVSSGHRAARRTHPRCARPITAESGPAGSDRKIEGGKTPMSMIALGADHGGYELKEAVKKHLDEIGGSLQGFRLLFHRERRLSRHGRARLPGRSSRGSVTRRCSSAAPASASASPRTRSTASAPAAAATISAPSTPGCTTTPTPLCLGGRVVGAGLAIELVDVFLNTAYEGGRHARRVAKIAALEEKG